MDNLDYEYECIEDLEINIVGDNYKYNFATYNVGRKFSKNVIETLETDIINKYFKKVPIANTMDNIKVLNQNILLKKIVEERKLMSSGLILTADDEIDNRYHKGKIIKAGLMLQSELKEGSIIYYDKMSGFDIRLNGELYTIIKEANAQIIIEE